MLPQLLPIQMLIDSKQVSDPITKGVQTTKKRLMVYIAAVIESYDRREIELIAIINLKDIPEVALTKPRDHYMLERILKLNKLDSSIKQWVIIVILSPGENYRA